MLLGMTCTSSSSVIFVGHTDQLQCNRSDLWIVCLLCVKHNLCKPSTQTATASSITWSSSTLFRYQTISQEPITRIITWLPISIPQILDRPLGHRVTVRFGSLLLGGMPWSEVRVCPDTSGRKARCWLDVVLNMKGIPAPVIWTSR